MDSTSKLSRGLYMLHSDDPRQPVSNSTESKDGRTNRFPETVFGSILLKSFAVQEIRYAQRTLAVAFSNLYRWKRQRERWRWSRNQDARIWIQSGEKSYSMISPSQALESGLYRNCKIRMVRRWENSCLLYSSSSPPTLHLTSVIPAQNTLANHVIHPTPHRSTPLPSRSNSSPSPLSLFDFIISCPQVHLSQ